MAADTSYDVSNPWIIPDMDEQTWILQVSTAKKKLKLGESQTKRFILGPELSGSNDSSEALSSPVKSRWSSMTRHNAKTSPTKSPFSQIRNRTYMLAVAPQLQSPTAKSKRNKEVASRTLNFNSGSGTLLSRLSSSGNGNLPDSREGTSYSAVQSRSTKGRTKHQSRSPTRRRKYVI